VVTPDASVFQRIARYLLIGALMSLGAWMLQHFLPALCWAIVLAIGTSKLYDRWLTYFRGKHRDILAALTFTTILALVLIVPLIYGGIIAVREAISLTRTLLDSSKGPPELPQWLQQLPWLGDWLNGIWLDKLSSAAAHGPGAAHGAAAAQGAGGEHAGAAGSGASPGSQMYQWTRVVGVQLLRRLSTLVFTLLTLYFVYLNRDSLARDVPRVGCRLFGPSVEGLLTRASDAIRATVDGIVLVAVAEGAIMAGVYAIAGAPHPILIGAVTGVFAMIPFAAPIVFGAVALLLASQNAVGAAIGVLISGGVVLFVADHFVRPVIIGEGAKLPFLWVLLGILGGVESFGLVGIFLGPALMAALVAVWRSWVTESQPS
jgi:predicted PurR-regulated permease PerM